MVICMLLALLPACAPKTEPKKAPESAVPTEPPTEKPLDPQCVETAWKYAETANREYGFSLIKDTCEAFYDANTGRLERMEFTNKKPENVGGQSLYVYFDRETGTQVSYTNLCGDYQADAPDTSSLSEEERTVLSDETARMLSGKYNVSVDDITAAGYALDGTDRDYATVAEYCLGRLADELMNCSMNNSQHCDKVEISVAYNTVKASGDYTNCEYTLYFRPTYPQVFTSQHGDVGCAIKPFDDPEHPGCIYFGGYVLMSKTANTWDCHIGFGGG